jgi:uncharacterized damage-inducible protein DinB
MTLADLLVDAFTRIRDGVHDVLDGLTPQDLEHRPTPHSNSIAWLVWHLSRVQDDHVAEVAGRGQVWHDGWFERFGLPLHRDDTGYGHSTDEVGVVRGLDAELLRGYHDAVHEQTVSYVRGLDADDLDRVVDEGWDPPVTLGVRLVSVVNDDQQHVGQAAFVRGLLEDRT